MRRFNTGWKDGYYGLASGQMEAGESPTAAALREAREEAGIDVRPEDLNLIVTMHRKPAGEGDAEYVDFFFTTENWTGEPRLLEPDKCDEAGWFSLDALPENLLEYVQDVFRAMQEGKKFIER